MPDANRLTDKRPKLLVIVGSTRPGRVGRDVADWLVALAGEHGGFEVDLADLQELALPMMNEPHHPRLRRYQFDHTKGWSARVDAADAIVVVTPEYNGTFSAPLKNAIDYLNTEWRRKPVGIVAYGGISAGSRAATNFREVAATLGMVTSLVNVMVSMVRQHVREDGTFAAPETAVRAALGMLDELVELDGALRPLRQARALATA